MKKVSTVGAKQSRNISQPKLTIGLDLGDRNSWYCMVDEAGQIRPAFSWKAFTLTPPMWRFIANNPGVRQSQRLYSVPAKG